MLRHKKDERFFESTRGQIVLFLFNSDKTVNEIAAHLGLTDNAIRAHMTSLERDGLVTTTGSAKGYRKPHRLFGLTNDARSMFPKFYSTILNRLLDSLKTRISKIGIKEIMAEIGLGIGKENKDTAAADEKSRIKAALKALESLGGSAVAFEKNGHTIIESQSCPFGETVAEHPEVCRMAESMIEEIVGTEVREKCDRTASPKCCFEIIGSDRDESGH